MSRYRRRTRVAAPLEDVWAFHSRIGGLEALTPGWMNLRVEAVRGPDGDDNPDVLETGTQIRLSTRPFDVGPRQEFVSRIVVREEGEGTARFVDDMLDGPFRHWEHTHRFFADGDETIVEDDVEYAFPVADGILGPLAVVGFEPMFRYRHRKTRQLLE